MQGRGEANFLVALTDLFPFTQQGVLGTTAFLKLNTALQLSWSQKVRHILEAAPVLLHRNDAGESIKADGSSENQNLQSSFSSASSQSSCFCVELNPNKAASPEPWTPYSLTEGRSLQASGISVSGKPGKYSFQASNTSSWQANLAGSRH